MSRPNPFGEFACNMADSELLWSAINQALAADAVLAGKSKEFSVIEAVMYKASAEHILAAAGTFPKVGEA